MLKRSMLGRLIVIVATTIVMLAGLGVVSAQAQYPTDSVGVKSGSYTKTHPKRNAGDPCRRKAKRNHTRVRTCHGKVRVHASGTHRLRRKMVAKYGTLVSSKGVTLRQAYNSSPKARAAIKWRTFWQTGISTKGVNLLYDVKHEGMGFWDGKQVWLNAPDGRPGDHSCFKRHALGFDVGVDSCYERLRYTSANTPYFQYWCRFSVAPIWRSIPLISTLYNMHVNLHASGRLTFWWDNHRRLDLPA